MRALYGLFWTLAIIVFLMISWLTVGTDVLLRVASMNYGLEYTTIVRSTPYGEVFADWAIEARVVETGIECPENGTATYQKREDDTVTYPTPDKLKPCLAELSQVVVVQTWRAWLFGIIPLRPTQLVTILNDDAQ